MRLYAIRDRLIGYYMTPFAAPGDKDVLASLAQTINSGDNNVPLAQAPHHYEIWRLAEINEETGEVTPGREFIGDGSSLIRTKRESAESGGRQTAIAPERGQGAPNGHDSPESARVGAIQTNAQSQG